MLTRSEKARQIARRIARRTFAGHWDADNLMNDVESIAWDEERRAGPTASASQIAVNALKKVKVGRQFSESVRSITTSRFDRRSKRPSNLCRVEFKDVAADDLWPTEAVPNWLFYEDWLDTLDSRRREIAQSLAAGGRTGEVAADFDVSDSRIAQMRREFETSWKEFEACCD
jgi:hypothetical protein